MKWSFVEIVKRKGTWSYETIVLNVEAETEDAAREILEKYFVLVRKRDPDDAAQDALDVGLVDGYDDVNQEIAQVDAEILPDLKARMDELPDPGS